LKPNSNLMSFSGSEDHKITLVEGSALTKRYRNSVPPGTTIGHFVGKDDLVELLNQPSCVGVRIYYALGTDNRKELVLVGVKSNEDDLFEGIILDKTLGCPVACAADNPLNSNVTP
jgi:hypothetical protein